MTFPGRGTTARRLRSVGGQARVAVERRVLEQRQRRLEAELGDALQGDGAVALDRHRQGSAFVQDGGKSHRAGKIRVGTARRLADGIRTERKLPARRNV